MTIPDFNLNDRFLIHCWIDLPIATLHSDVGKHKMVDDDDDAEGKKASDGGLINLVNLVTDVSSLFQGVIGQDEDFASLSDVTLVVSTKADNSDGRFLCHRNTLASRSPVFRRMFANKQWKEGADKEERLVEIEDIEEEIMKLILQYIYKGEFPDVQCDLMSQIVYAADKYQLQN